MKITFKKETKQGSPLLVRNIIPNINKTEYKYSLKFTEESIYIFDNKEDQEDWRKACGVSFNRLDNHELCAMVAYNYDVEEKLFNIAPYFHFNYSKSWIGGGGNYKDKDDKSLGLSKNCLLKVKLNEEIFISLKIKNNILTYTFIIGDEKSIFYFDFKTKMLSWEIQPWFGGTNSYEENTSFELNIL